MKKNWKRKRGIPYSPEVITGWGEDKPLTKKVIDQLATLMTNVDKPVFAFYDAMPAEVVAALFSRYSRSSRPLRYVLAREFLQETNSRGSQRGNVTDKEKARQFFARVLAEYGDDSVAQLGRVNLGCEMVSQLAIKEIEDGRLGAYLEKSTRYVDFGVKINGSYLYFRPPEIINSSLKKEFLQLMDEAFENYKETTTALKEYLQKKFPMGENVDEKVYRASIRAKAFDIARVYLPMASLTNVGMNLSGQTTELMINKMLVSPLLECRWLAGEIKTEVEKIIPSLLTRIDVDKFGGKFRSYLEESKNQTRRMGKKWLSGEENSGSTEKVKLINSTPNALEKVVTEILWPLSNKTEEEMKKTVDKMALTDKKNIIDAYLVGRTDRRHKPGRAFEEAVYTFAFTGNVGIWRDLQRHRMLTQKRQVLTTEVGLEVPSEMGEIRLRGKTCEEMYRSHMRKSASMYKKIAKNISPEIAQYVVSFGHLMRWNMTVNLRELYHVIPLRAGSAGHPAYREIAREMFYKIAEVDPILAMPMHQFVDFSDEPRLERLKQLTVVKAELDKLGGAVTGDTFN